MAEPNFWKRIERLEFADLESLRELGRREHTRLDYKAFAPFMPPNQREIDAAEVAADFCSLANAGGGRIIFGAVDDRQDGIKKFVGVPEARHQAVRSMIRSAGFQVEPPPVLDLRSIPHDNRTFLVVAEVRPGGGGPHQVAGKYWVRVSDGNRPMPHSSVVHAVLANRDGAATSWRQFEPARPSGVGGTTTFDEGKLRGYFLGVDLRPSYDLPGQLCHPLSEEAEAMVEACGAGAQLGRHGITCEPQVLEDDERFRIDVNFDHGLATGTRLLKAGATPAMLFQNRWDNITRRLARVLSKVAPDLLVDVKLGLWSHGGQEPGLLVKWSETESEGSRETRLGPAFLFVDEVEKELPIGELLEDDVRNKLSLFALELLRLHVRTEKKP
jgi:hypothetical protein